MTAPAEAVPAQVADVVGRPYSRVFTPQPEGGFLARVLEFPGCISEGDTIEEAAAMVEDALEGIVASMLDRGDPIPAPLCDTEYGGRISLRIPPSLHAEAVELAAVMGVSLNRFLSDAVARHVGALKATRRSG
jgi:antitoxin HicB